MNDDIKPFEVLGIFDPVAHMREKAYERLIMLQARHCVIKIIRMENKFFDKIPVQDQYGNQYIHVMDVELHTAKAHAEIFGVIT